MPQLNKEQMLFALLALILPNFLIFLVSGYFNLVRPLINLDYILCFIVGSLGFRRSALSLLCFLFFIDLFAISSQVFVLMRLSDIFFIAKFLLLSSVYYKIMAVVVVVYLLLKIYVIDKTIRDISFLTALLLFNAAVVVYSGYVYLDDESQENNRAWRVVKMQVVGSQLVSVYETRSMSFFKNFDQTGALFSDLKIIGATHGLRKTIQNDPDKLPAKIMLIVVESWGVSKNKNIQDAILSPLIHHQNITIRNYGSIDFRGVTIGGEMRELCERSPLHFNIKDAENSVLKECLPNKLLALGYDTQSLHSAAGLMYDRVYWYPKVGFEKSVFFESRSWPRRCYSFPGGCDVDMADEVPHFFESTQKGFLYWLTLNSHSLYDERDILVDKFDCQAYGLHQQQESCRNFKLQAQFFDKFATLLDHPSMKGVHIVVVGDHPAVIMDKQDNLENYQDGVVPWLEFEVI